VQSRSDLRASNHFRITLDRGRADIFENSNVNTEAKLRVKSNVRCPELGRFGGAQNVIL
jgi:hypothetical protein